MSHNPSAGPHSRPPGQATPGAAADGPETIPPLRSIAPPGGGTARLSLQPGARPLPDYELVQPLGKGGFGEVWKARGPGGFHVALKFIQLGDQAGAVELRSLELMKGVRHPNLLGLFGCWQRDGYLIVAMELADRTLLDRLTEAQRQGSPGIPRKELLPYAYGAAQGIDHLNALGVQHRDVKPHNLLLVGSAVKVADFGLAKELEHTRGSHTGSMTLAYAAPEFFHNQVSAYSDQYSLAVAYCQLRGGRLPFGGNQAQMTAGHLFAAPDLSMLPEAERPVLARALAKKPEERWPSCTAFVQGLAANRAAHPSTIDGRPPATLPPPRTNGTGGAPQRTARYGPAVVGVGVALLLAACLVVGSILLIGLVGHRRNDPAESLIPVDMSTTGQDTKPEPRKGPAPVTTVKKQDDRPPDKAPEEPTKTPSDLPPSEVTLQLEVLTDVTAQRDGGPDAVAQQRYYHLDGTKDLQTLTEIKDVITQRLSDKPALKRLEVLMFKDSPNETSGRVKVLRTWAEKNGLEVKFASR